jgi:hypothetical protein
MSESKGDGVKAFDFYEFGGILAPGALALFGLSRMFPDAGFHIATKEMTLGDFGLFAILSYAAGHLIQIVGDIVEQLWWWMWGGFPSDWVRHKEKRFGGQLISAAQRLKMISKIRELVGLTINLETIGRKDWHGCFRQIYGIVVKAKLSQRADSFNRTYGLLRGMVSGCLLLAAAHLLKNSTSWDMPQTLLMLAGFASLARMHLFARHYAREVFVQFLNVHPEDLKSAQEKG